MSHFKWLDEYNIGNDEIDRQHQYLFDLANQIVDPENDPQKTHHNVLALVYYVREHFNDEQSLMQQCDYPRSQEHIQKHDELIQRLTEISADINTGEASPEEIMSFMQNKLLEHIFHLDVLLAESLRQQTNKLRPKMGSS